MAQKKGRVVSNLTGRSIMKQPPGGTKIAFIKGPGGDDIVCHKCGFVLLTGIAPGMVQNIVFICPNCETPNDVTV